MTVNQENPKQLNFLINFKLIKDSTFNDLTFNLNKYDISSNELYL